MNYYDFGEWVTFLAEFFWTQAHGSLAHLKIENVFYFIIFIHKFVINLLTLSLFIDRYPTSDLFGVESNTAK